LSADLKIKLKKNRKKKSRRVFRGVTLIILCCVLFLFTVSYIRYQQCVLKNQQLKSTYENLLVEFKELQEDKNIIEGVNIKK